MRLQREYWLCVRSVTLLLVFLGLAVGAQAANGPNVLFLFADDQRADTIAALGNPHIKTPNLDALSQRAFRFSQAYCMGSMGGAVCVPSRAMVNSGRTLFRAPTDLAGVTTLAEVMRQAGYETFGTGKWHNRPPAFLRGFARGKAIFFGGMSNHLKVPLVDLSTDGTTTPQRTGKKFSSTLFADAAIDFLKHRDTDAPFYAYVAFTAPHDPRQAPEGYIDMYDPRTIPLPPNYMPQHPFFNGWMTGRDEALAAWPRTKSVVRQQLAEYYGLITHLDHEIGRVLTVLEETGEADNTIIVYAADHGLAIGSHGLLGKQNLYEHSTKAPLMFAGPGIPAGKSSDAFAYLFDVFPTLCELTGVDEPDGVEGHSLAPIWRGEKDAVRDSVYTAFGTVMRAVRQRQWKLIRYTQINKSQLFDLANDPYELHDLAGQQQYAPRVAEMTSLLGRWQRDLGDELSLTSADPKPAAIDLTGRKRKPDQHQPEWIVRKYFGN